MKYKVALFIGFIFLAAICLQFDVPSKIAKWLSGSPTAQMDYYTPKILIYKSDLPIYTDRPYINTLNSKFFERMVIVILPRHRKKNFTLKFDCPVIVYRFVNSDNSNILYKEWESSNLKVELHGKVGAPHDSVIKKPFKSGVYSFSAGGPLASDPLFIDWDSLEHKRVPVEFVDN